MSEEWLVVMAMIGIPIVGIAVLLSVLVLLGRRARAGVRSGRNTARPGNSWNNF
ncbi:hypothetical protein OG792_28850 [Micromonospora sp. NBC_01699]|uniref:hypothetical protein n=1 Tax=Micromonospora sp. NBC_01699 TaxID=2975984 RepID=UPI002E2DC195|nr:hypothetical protein [Micromonospora sp. NBC_01699]